MVHRSWTLSCVLYFIYIYTGAHLGCGLCLLLVLTLLISLFCMCLIYKSWAHLTHLGPTFIAHQCFCLAVCTWKSSPKYLPQQCNLIAVWSFHLFINSGVGFLFEVLCVSLKCCGGLMDNAVAQNVRNLWFESLFFWMVACTGPHWVPSLADPASL